MSKLDMEYLLSEQNLWNMGYNIKPNENIPDFIFDDKLNIFFRGFYDKNGDMTSKTMVNSEFKCFIKFEDHNLLNKMSKYYGIANTFFENSNILCYDNHNALDFLSRIYKNSDARFRCIKKYNAYVNWTTFGLYPNIPVCKFFKKSPEAVIPTKSRASDVGYDLTIIKLCKKLGEKTFMYDTDIIVSPNFGYYTKIVPRSSLVKSGYMLSNSMGIIDPSYLGTLKIVLTKVDDSFPDLTLPFKCCQLIIDRAIHYDMEEILDEKEFTKSERSVGGFGSTDNKI